MPMYIVKHRTALMVFILLLSHILLFCQEIPLGYKNYFSHNCTNESLFKFLLPEYDQDWMIVKGEGENYLRIKSTNDSVSRSIPDSRSVLNNMIFGDFILEFEFKTVPIPGRDTTGFSFLGPIKSRDYYYSWVFFKDSLRFYVIDHDTIQSCKTRSIAPLNTAWNTIRIQRDILTRTMFITINGDAQNKLSFTDRKLVMGYIGFGTHQSTSYIRNIKLWAPTAFEEKSFQW